MIAGKNTLKKQKKRVLTLSVEHREDSYEYSKNFHGKFNWLLPKVLATLPNIQKLKIRESLQKNNLETKAEYKKSIKVLSKDRANIINTNSWKTLFCKIDMVHQANVLKFGFVLTILYTLSLCLEPQKSLQLTSALDK